MSFIQGKTSNDFASGNLNMLLEINIMELVENDLYDELRKYLKVMLQTEVFQEKITSEIEKMLAKTESKAVLTRMISEVVSETIKTTLLELKQQGVI